MNIRSASLFALVLTLVFPTGVTLIVWYGLRQLEMDIQLLTEEFDEAVLLRPIENNLSVALILLDETSLTAEESVLQRLHVAEQGLIVYLGEQYDGNASKDHQGDESLHASNALMGLQELIGPRWASLTGAQRREAVQSIQGDITNLYEDTGSGVLSVPALAHISHGRTLYAVFGVTLVAVASCSAFSLLILRSVHRRLLVLKRGIEEQSDIGSRGEAKDVDAAMSQLESLNEQMLQSIQDKNRELLRRERVFGIGLLAADVAHEINNPMNAMLGLSELSLRTLSQSPLDEQSQGELHQSLSVIRRELLRCRGIIEQLMAMVRTGGKPHWFDINHLLSETVAVARAARPDKGNCFHLLGSDRSLRGYAPQQEIRQILLTLLINAADAIGDQGRIEVDATRAQGEIWIRVRDNGRGFTPSMQKDFSIPFNTDRAEDGGTGLGLSIAYALTREIGAELRSSSDGPGTGSMFLLAITDQEQAS